MPTGKHLYCKLCQSWLDDESLPQPNGHGNAWIFSSYQDLTSVIEAHGEDADLVAYDCDNFLSCPHPFHISPEEVLIIDENEEVGF